MAISKTKIRKNFTQVGNAIFKDDSLSMKDKGVYCTLCSFPEDWNFSIEGMSTLSSDGGISIRSSLKKLEARGYITITPTRDKKGRFETVIDIHAVAISKSEFNHTHVKDIRNDKSKHDEVHHGEDRRGETQHDEDQHGEDHRGETQHGEDQHGEDRRGETQHGEDQHGEDRCGETQHGETEYGESNTENITPYNKSKRNNIQIAKSIPINQSISDGQIEKLKATIAENICLSRLLESANDQGEDEVHNVNALYNLICETVCYPKEYIYINGNPHPWKSFKEQYLKLRYEHLVAILKRFSGTILGSKKNKLNYLRATLYNEPLTSGIKLGDSSSEGKGFHASLSSNLNRYHQDYNQRVYTDEDYIAFERKKLGIK